MENPSPSPLGLARSAGLSGLVALARIKPFTTLWRVIDGYFRDPRLRQLFGRYATYCGSSPFEAPGPLMLIAHVEQTGVWLVEGGMMRIATTLEASRQGSRRCVLLWRGRRGDRRHATGRAPACGWRRAN